MKYFNHSTALSHYVFGVLLSIHPDWQPVFQLASSQAMAPRPSMGVPAPRAMPPYKYATGVRNPNPQVVQPALQQVQKKKSSSLSFFMSLIDQ